MSHPEILWYKFGQQVATRTYPQTIALKEKQTWAKTRVWRVEHFVGFYQMDNCCHMKKMTPLFVWGFSD
jgi:hypothetical protein